MYAQDQTIQQAKAGNAAAFELLVQQNAQFIFNLALRILHNPQEAEDLSQEAFLRAWRALPRFREGSSFRTWLYRIVVNLCYDRLPGLKRELSTMDPDEMLEIADRQQTPEEHQLSTEEQHALQRAFQRLPARYRLLLTLRHMQELSYNEIADITGIPLGTVKTGLHRGRQRLKEMLKDGEHAHG